MASTLAGKTYEIVGAVQKAFTDARSKCKGT